MEKVPVMIEMYKDVAEAYRFLPESEKSAVVENLNKDIQSKIEAKRAKLKADIYASFGFDKETIEQIEEQRRMETLEELLDRMHQQAQANGMTEEIFNELLKDDE